MKLIIFGVLVVILSFCSAEDLICELFDETLTSVKYFVGGTPEECSLKHQHKTLSVHQIYDVKRLKIAGCEPNILLNTIQWFANGRELDI